MEKKEEKKAEKKKITRLIRRPEEFEHSVQQSTPWVDDESNMVQYSGVQYEGPSIPAQRPRQPSRAAAIRFTPLYGERTEPKRKKVEEKKEQPEDVKAGERAEDIAIEYGSHGEPRRKRRSEFPELFERAAPTLPQIQQQLNVIAADVRPPPPTKKEKKYPKRKSEFAQYVAQHPSIVSRQLTKEGERPEVQVIDIPQHPVQMQQSEDVKSSYTSKLRRKEVKKQPPPSKEEEKKEPPKKAKVEKKTKEKQEKTKKLGYSIKEQTSGIIQKKKARKPPTPPPEKKEEESLPELSIEYLHGPGGELVLAAEDMPDPDVIKKPILQRPMPPPVPILRPGPMPPQIRPVPAPIQRQAQEEEEPEFKVEMLSSIAPYERSEEQKLPPGVMSEPTLVREMRKTEEREARAAAARAEQGLLLPSDVQAEFDRKWGLQEDEQSYVPDPFNPNVYFDDYYAQQRDLDKMQNIEPAPLYPEEWKAPPILPRPDVEQPFRAEDGSAARLPEQPARRPREVQLFSPPVLSNYNELEALSSLVKLQVKTRIERMTGDDKLIAEKWANKIDISTSIANGVILDMVGVPVSEFLDPDYKELVSIIYEAVHVVYQRIPHNVAAGINVRVVMYLDRPGARNSGFSVANSSFFNSDVKMPEEFRKKTALDVLKQLIPVLSAYTDLAISTKRYSTSDVPIMEENVPPSFYTNIKKDQDFLAAPLYIKSIIITPVSYDEGRNGRLSALLNMHNLLRKYLPYLTPNDNATYDFGINPIIRSFSNLTGVSLPSHLISFKTAVSKIKKYVLFSGLTDEGICFFEALVACMLLIEGDVQIGKIVTKSKGWKKEEAGWKKRVLKEFLSLKYNEKDIFIDGDYKKYVDTKLCDRYGVGVYNFVDGKMYGPVSSWVVVLYGGHAYATLYELVAGNSLPKPRSIESGVRSGENHAYCLKFIQHKPEDESIMHRHFAYDFETLDSGNGVQIPYLLVLRDLDETNPPRVFYGIGCEYEFVISYLMPLVSQIREEKKTYYHFWSYNGSNFDIHFIVKVLMHVLPLEITGSHLSIKKLKIGRCIEFLDLAAWYISVYDKKTKKRGLDALAAATGLNIRKLPFDHKSVNFDIIKTESFKQAAIRYCTQDCDVLAALVKKLVIEALDNFNYGDTKMTNLRLFPCSAASLAKKFYEYFFCVEDVPGTPDVKRLKKERNSYKGGLTLALKPIAENLRCYDINSSYPSVMCEPMPYFFMGWSQRWVGCMITEPPPDTWLYGVTGFEFPPETKLPCFMVRGKNGIVLPLKWAAESEEKAEYYWGCEIKVALSLKAKIFVCDEIQYKGMPIFREFVECFYNKRLEAKAKKQSHLVLFYKILMNSLQGKLGQRDFGNCEIGTVGALRQAVASIADAYDLQMISEAAFKAKYETQERDKCKKIGSLVRFPSYIAARGRCKLHEAAQTVIEDVAYMDTDSIFLANDRKLSPEFVDESKLGKFKEETDKACSLGIFFGAKNYCLYTAGDVNIACKGSRFEFNEEYRKFIEEYKEHINDPAKIATLKSAKLPLFTKQFGRVQVLENYKMIKPTFRLKRKPLGQRDSIPFSTLEEADKVENPITKRKTEVCLKYIEAQVRREAEVEAKKAVKGIFIDVNLEKRSLKTEIEEAVYGRKEELDKIRLKMEEESAILPELKEEAGAQMDNWGPEDWYNVLNLEEISDYFSSVN